MQMPLPPSPWRVGATQTQWVVADTLGLNQMRMSLFMSITLKAGSLVKKVG